MVKREGAAGFSAWIYVLRTVRRNKGRTTLMVAGVAVLVAFFVLFAALGAGLQEYVDEEGDAHGYDRLKGRNAADYGRISTVVGEWMTVITVVIAVIMAMTVMNAMLLSVTERTPEIGTLRAVGVTRPRIYQLVMMEAAYLSGLGFLIGAISGLLSALVLDIMCRASGGEGWYFAPASVNAGLMAWALLLSGGVGCAVSLIPAYRAARMDPLEALRYE